MSALRFVIRQWHITTCRPSLTLQYAIKHNYSQNDPWELISISTTLCKNDDDDNQQIAIQRKNNSLEIQIPSYYLYSFKSAV